jgi:hypothetical protein
MRPASLAVVSLAASVAFAPGCATTGAAPLPELEVPVLVPPPAPPRIIATYIEPEPPPPPEPPETVEPPTVARPQPRPAAPPPTPEPAVPMGPPAPPPALTLTPAPGTEAKTEASIRELLGRASGNISRVNTASLSADGRTQLEAARRFVEQAEEALKARNLLFAGKLADKAVAMSAVLVR